MVNNTAASTSKGEARAEPGVTTKKPRPKPRRKLPTGLIHAAPFALPSDISSTTTPATRNVPATVLLEPVLPADLKSQDIPLTIADRAKSRVRNAKSKPVVQDIIDIHSDEDEHLLRLSPHRPKQKDVHRTKARPDPIPDPLPPSIHPSQESLVTPTSDFQPIPAISSQLPPSDPPSSTIPLPTSTPESAKKRRQVPDFYGVEESRSSSSKKRKQQHVAIDDDEDNRTRISRPQAIEMDDQPPPNFFASSSSSHPPPPAPLAQGEYIPLERNLLTDNVPPPEAIGSDRPREKKSRPKPKKKYVAQPDTNNVEKLSSISASTSRRRLDAEGPVYKSAEVVGDSDEEAGLLVLPPPESHQLDHQSPPSDLSETENSRASGPITPSNGPKRFIPEVLITTVPRKRTSSPPVEEGRSVHNDKANGSPKGKKRQKKAVEEGYFDGLDEEVTAAPKNGPKGKGKGKAPLKGKSRMKPQPKEVVDDEEFEEDRVDNATGARRKAKTRSKAKAVQKAKSIAASTVAPSSESDPANVKHIMGDSVAQRKDEILQHQDIVVSPSLAIGSETVLICDLKEDQENTPLSPNSKPSPAITPSSVSRKTPAPTSFARLNYGHSLANGEKPMTMTEIIKKAGSATGIKSYSSFTKGSRSVLRKIAPLHARRKTPPPLPPKPPPPKKTKKQLELEERWEEELEETIEGWTALTSEERELLRKQKRDMEMGYED